MSTERELGEFEARITALEERMPRIEDKIDKLLDFRGWVMGGVAAISAAISLVVTFLFKK